MADGADLIIDGKALDAAADKLIRGYLSAGTKAVSGTARNLEKRLEAATQAAVPGKLWRAWQSSAFPRSGPARNPIATVWLKGRADGRTGGAVSFWTQPGEIRGKRGQYLAVPLPSAGSRGRGRDLTPGEWERRTGQRLQFIYRAGNYSLLVATGGTTNARSGAFRQLTGGRQRAGRGGANPLQSSVVPIFVLIPVVRFRNAFAIEPIVNAADGELAREFFNAIRGLSLR